MTACHVTRNPNPNPMTPLIKQCAIVRNAFDTANEITKLINKSPRRDASLKLLPHLQVLERCAQQGGPQMHAECLGRIITNHE